MYHRNFPYTHIYTSTHYLVIMVNITYVKKLDLDEEECSICKEVQSNTKLECGHSCFCMECISMWTRQNNSAPCTLPETTNACVSCPLCRASVTQVWTSDIKHRVPTDREEIFHTIVHLVRKHVSAHNQQTYIHVLSHKVRDTLKGMDARTVLRTIDARKGGIERALQCLPLTTLVKMIDTILANPITGDIPIMYIPAQSNGMYMYIV